MRMADAPRVREEKQHECPICEAEGAYILYEGDKTCMRCGHTPGERVVPSEESDPWTRWFTHRKEEYSGFYGPDRIKMVGGFASSY